MKTTVKIVGSTFVLIAASLGLQAQATNQSNSATVTTPSSDTTKSASVNPANDQVQSRSTQDSPGAQNAANNSPSTTTSSASSRTSSTAPVPADNGITTNGSQPNDPTRGADTTNVTPGAGTNATPSITANGQSTTTTNGGVTTQQSATSNQTSLAASAQSDTDVTAIVQQIDTQGPAIVERVTTQFADVTCTPENAKLLFNALRDGTEVSLSADGKTVTFTPAGGKLGYGDAYIALALAAEALHNAGVTGCATPEQWKSVLIGGPLAASGTSSTSTSTIASASSTSQFPGILTLHSQGQGWGQVAQTTHVQLGQVVSNAHSSLNLNSDSKLTPTGKTSAEMQQERMNAGKDNKDHQNGHDQDRDNDKGFDQSQGANANPGAATQPNR